MRRVSFATMILVALIASQSIAGPSLQRLSDNAKIDWTNLLYVAKGEGAMPSSKEEPNRGKAYLKARDYARMAAIANLLAAIEGTAISYESVGKDYMANTKIHQKIEGYVKNVQVTKTYNEKVEGSTLVIVEVRATMFGQEGPGSVFLDHEEEVSPDTDVRVVTKPDVKPLIPTVNLEPKPLDRSQPFTSVIFDTSGYKLDRCMSPKIRRPDGSEVWGSVKVDRDIVLERGIVSYVTSLTDAMKNLRCGSNPLVINAVGRAGGRFNSDPVISDVDAEMLLAENAKSGFMDKLNVIIIKDGRL